MQKKSFETILYSTAGVAIMGAILIAINIIAGSLRHRVDLTEEKAYTLSDGTRTVLGELDTPVKVRFYCTQGEGANAYSAMLKAYARKVEDLLAEFKHASRGNLVIEKLDPQPDSDAEDSARLDGVEPQALPGGEQFYLGLSVGLLDAKEAIPFLSPGRERQLEYDISRAITRVVKPEKPVVGVMSALPVFGQMNPMMMQMGRGGQQPWMLVTALGRDFTLRQVEMNAERIDDDIKVLLVIHPRDISEASQYAIDQFVLRGGKLIAFLDALSLVDSRSQNPMMGNLPGGGSSLDQLLGAWGLQFDSTKVVADRNLKMVLGDDAGMSQHQPAWLALPAESIHREDIITGELDNVWYFAGGAFTGKPAEGLRQTVLLKSSTDSQLVEGMLANLSAETVLKEFKSSGTEYALAVRLSGKFKTAFPNGKPGAAADTNAPAAFLKESAQENTVILVGDADMIYDRFSLQRDIFGGAQPANGNLFLAQNALEQLSGDENLIAIRGRGVTHRPFTRVKKIEAEADIRYMAKIKELEESRNQAVERLNELQQQKNQNQRFILSPEQQAEIENLRKKEAEVRRELREVDKSRRRDIVSLQQKVQWLNIAGMPLAVSLVGIGLAVYKRKRTR